ncbi:DUF4238 domain-containing protein [Pseudomonas atacamensis]|uniref:DUF4238 domain-containing protein n=1 Tax=Pseudomonas atacamensis TaxID=2565368 RepID=UPI001FAE4C50|nr:DUF4238 domain-containing protein [Pseudomonas atacamensis]MCI9875094.1 DUF4238 domain-containing protein [Pseudomonas atacamensis]
MNPKDFEVKRKHHYVWARYLQAWASKKEIHYITKKGLPATESVKGVAKELGFYKITTFNDDDLLYIRTISKLASKDLQQIHEGFLNNFIAISNILKGRAREHQPDTDLVSQILQFNVLEDMHGKIERQAWPMISELRKGNTSLLADIVQKHSFFFYIAQQLVRTKTVRDKSLDASSRHLPQFVTDAMKRNWWFVSFLLGINLGKGLLEVPKERHFLIENKTIKPFITSDRPVVNVHSCMCMTLPDEPPEKLDLYYPLSPTHAYMINDSEDYNHLKEQVTIEDVIHLNKRMAETCGETVYSSTKESILQARQYIPQWKR